MTRRINYSPATMTTPYRHDRYRLPLIYRLFALLTLLTIGGGWYASRASAAVTGNQETDAAVIIAKCTSDLAQRFKLQTTDITLVETRPTTWPDAALGMPAEGKLYAQVETPGWKIILEARNVRYLYTTSTTAYRYGGPVDAWAYSTLYLMPVADEPNLNGDLYQCSLLGTNSVRIASGVTAYYRENGNILFTRRISRSGEESGWSMRVLRRRRCCCSRALISARPRSIARRTPGPRIPGRNWPPSGALRSDIPADERPRPNTADTGWRATGPNRVGRRSTDDSREKRGRHGLLCHHPHGYQIDLATGVDHHVSRGADLHVEQKRIFRYYSDRYCGEAER